MTLQTERCAGAAEAARTLAGNPRARLSGGGTLVMRALNDGDGSFDHLVHHDDPRAKAVRVQGDRLHLGAGVTMAGVLRSRDAVFLHGAARLVGGPAVRNMATVGGNLFAPSPYGDLATALLALDATWSGADGAQPQSLESLFAQRSAQFVPGSRIVAAPLVLEIQCRRPASPEELRFLKVSRVKPKGISVLSIAAWLPGAGRAGGGARITGARIAFGAMGVTPLRAFSAERAIEGRALDAATIEAACAVCTEGLSPPTDAIASSWYRTAVAPVHLRRLLSGDSVMNRESGR